MNYVNRVELVGNLGNDPKALNEDVKGKFVTASIATNKQYKDAEGKVVKSTQWHTVYLSNDAAAYVLSHFVKGAKVSVVGELRHHEWVDKNGVKHYSTGIYVTKECSLLSQKTPSTSDASQSAA